MPKRRTIVIMIACGLLVVVLYAVLSRSREPSYQGRPLSVWLELYITPPKMSLSRQQEVAADAIRQIGTNAIPFLLEWIRYAQPPGKQKRLDALKKPLHWLNMQLGAEGDWTLVDTDLQRAERATLAFAALRAEAKAAVPELTWRLNQSESTPASGRAARALANMGALGVPPLVQALTNLNPKVRARAALNMEHLGTNAQPIIPILIRSLRDKDWLVVFGVLRTLRVLKVDSSLGIPVLAQNLQDSKPEVRASSAFHLSTYGEEARSAVPALLRTLADPNSNVCAQVTKALRIIAPEALTNALQSTNAPGP